MQFKKLTLESPKRSHHSPTDWEGFFPYYAGFPEAFVRSIIESADLPSDATVLDPWNGSGTTTYVASSLGLPSLGLDLNPVMAVIARSRLLAVSEADSLIPMAKKLTSELGGDSDNIETDDPLLSWFTKRTAGTIRALERRIRQQLVGRRTLTPLGPRLERISGFAATFYVALFSVSRGLASNYRSSNPTWFRRPREHERKIGAGSSKIADLFVKIVSRMASTLLAGSCSRQNEFGLSQIHVADTALEAIPAKDIDLVLTSPPYCTRIDYTAATRVELAVLGPLLHIDPVTLRYRMIGSPLTPKHEIHFSRQWGKRCEQFLRLLRRHPSKASDSYYYKTHLDYFDKISRSIANVTQAMRSGGSAILVVQDSNYKDIHNDLPTIIVEMSEIAGLRLRRRDDFQMKRTMSGINPYSRKYKTDRGAVESVLCFQKIA